MDKKKPPETWVEQVDGIKKAVNDDPDKQRGKALGKLESASTKEISTKTDQPEKLKDLTGRGLENQGKTHAERVGRPNTSTAKRIIEGKKSGVSPSKGEGMSRGGRGGFLGGGDVKLPEDFIKDGSMPPDEPLSENKANDPSQNSPDAPKTASGNESPVEPQQLTSDEKSRVFDLLRDDKPFSFNDSQLEVPNLSDNERKDLILALNEYAPDKNNFREFYSDRNEPGAVKEEPGSNKEEINDPSQEDNPKFFADENEARTDYQELSSDEKSRVFDLLQDDQSFSLNNSQGKVPDLSDDDRKELMIALNEYTPGKPDLEEIYPDREISHNELSEDFLSGRDMPLGDDDGDDGGSDGGGDD